MITKTDFDAKLSSFNRKITENETKQLLVENKTKKLRAFDLSSFISKRHFEEDGTQTYLTFQPLYKYFTFITDTPYYISSWKSKGLSTESVKPLTTSDNSLAPALSSYGTKPRVKFTGSCLKQPKISHTHRKLVNIYIAYELNKIPVIGNNFPTLQNPLFGTVALTKNADIGKYEYSGYGIGFHRKSSFLFPGGRFGQNVAIFGLGVSSSAHIDNKKKYILILVKGPKQGLEYTLTAGKMYSTNFTVNK